MEIRDVLSPDRILLDFRAGDKARLLRELSTLAASELGLDPDYVSAEIAKREALGSTGVGNGVALPHARLGGLRGPFVLLARLHKSIDFDAIDGEPVDIVVLLLLPEGGEGRNGNALACVARTLRDGETLRKIRRAHDREALFRVVVGFNSAQ
jgi:PTS system nitrogen regulatory IIA component